jgi:predicted lipid-binding transport protein (Tim44 family)
MAGRPGGLFGGFGGMLGGLLMGGLLGSLLFGGMRGAGPGLLDILVIAGGLFLLFRFLKARRTAAQNAGPMYYQSGAPQTEERGSAGMGWGGAISKVEDTTAPRIPPGFNVDEFMKGAKAAYHRLQDSWNRRDLEDIRQFTSPEVWEEIHRQAQEQPVAEKTEIVLVNGQLLEVNTEGEDTVASVHFDVLMRETPEEERPKQVREVWHFSRKDNVPGSFWRLEGIQQMEG